jgi:copper(I)-binding protein
VVIGPHKRYAFEPGVVALELRKLHKELRRDDVIPVTLEFSEIGVIKVDAEVDSRTAVRYPPSLPIATGGAKAH